MKKLLFLCSVLFFTNAAFSKAAEDDKVLDFRGIFWGVPKDSCYTPDGKKVNFVLDRQSMMKNAYTIPNDNMMIGSVKCDRILYMFNDENRFNRVFIAGSLEQAETMKFILTYKFGDFKNESVVDDSHIMQWLIKDVTFTLKEINKSRFELTIESSWQASEDYKKNTSVDDF